MSPVHLPLLMDGVVMLRPLTFADVDAHIAGEDAELVRHLNEGPSTRRATTAYLRRCLLAWAAGGPTLGFGIRGAQTDILWARSMRSSRARTWPRTRPTSRTDCTRKRAARAWPPPAVILAGEFLAVRAENPVHGAD